MARALVQACTVRPSEATAPPGLPLNRLGLIERDNAVRLYCAVTHDAEPERLGLVNCGRLRDRPAMIEGPCVVVWESFAAALGQARRQFGDGPFKICSIDAGGLARASLNENLLLNRDGLRRHWPSDPHGYRDEVHLSNDALVPAMFRVRYVRPAELALASASSDGEHRGFSMVRAYLRARREPAPYDPAPAWRPPTPGPGREAGSLARRLS